MKNNHNQKIFQQLFVAIFSLLLATSCDKTSESNIDPLVDIEGQWNLLVVKNSIDLENGDDTNNDTNFDGQGLYFDFNNDGTYETNVSINLGSVSKSDEVISGTYNKNGEQLDLAYDFVDFGINANISLDIAELSNNSLVVIITENTLIKAFDENLGSLNALQRAGVQLFLGNILDLETRIEMSR